jgi:inhibitor of KinA
MRFKMSTTVPYRIFPLGDSALTIDFGNVIDETINIEVLKRFNYILQHPLPGIIEAVPAYSSLTLYYDVVALHRSIPKDHPVFDWMKSKAEQLLSISLPTEPTAQRTIRIPVCYDELFAPDIAMLAAKKQLNIDEVVQLHTSKSYRVYMLGFLPGFSYMGLVDERIAMARKSQPKQVAAGSVGIAGRQTGLYPLASPGGWQIIGRTPLRLFDAGREDPVMLRAGDMVEFYSISKDEFTGY